MVEKYTKTVINVALCLVLKPDCLRDWVSGGLEVLSYSEMVERVKSDESH